MMQEKNTISYIVTGLLLLLNGCSFKEAIEFRKLLTKTSVESADFSNGSRKVHYIDMVHLGQETFYKNVRDEIEKYKHDGYVLFYEWIDYENATDITLKKTKKIIGLIPSTKGYQKLISMLDVEGVVVQENSMFLNLVNQSDFNVDLTAEEVISLYEQYHGEIQLTEEEPNDPVDYKSLGTMPGDKAMTIVRDYRSKYLAEHIHSSQYDKIVVIYGKDHQNGLFDELVKLDDKWKRISLL